MAAAEWAGTLVDWNAELAAMKERIAPALGRVETRRSAAAFIDAAALDAWEKAAAAA